MAELDVRVVTPEQEVWSGRAGMVVATTTEGEIGILPGHAPLLALLGTGSLRISGGEAGEHVTSISGGFLHVAADRVDVLAEHAEADS
jgi:F-type H+-transporting ATPase subunit epsilon